MANTPQSKKRARQNERRAAVNKARRSRIRTFVRRVEEALESGDKDAASEALRVLLTKPAAHASAHSCAVWKKRSKAVIKMQPQKRFVQPSQK